MEELLKMIVPEDETEEIKEFISTLLLLSKEDRAVLLSNANAFRVRRDMERAKMGNQCIKDAGHKGRKEKGVQCLIDSVSK